MIFCVEVLAIYELPGTAVTNPRRNLRDGDFADAQTRAAAVGHAIDPQANEYMESFDANRYGFGWRCRQWISVKADADNVGQAIFTRLSGRNLQNGSKVQVFPKDDTQVGYVTGDVSYQRLWPTPNPSDVG